MSRQDILFIDRDGTLIAEPPVDKQVDSLAKLELEPLVIPTLLKLQKAGFILVMISNQDGLGTDSFPQDDFDAPHQAMLSIFNSQGIEFQDVLVCPHLPSDNCSCRKPKLGLVKDYLTQGSINFENSYVIGDRTSDMELAAAMGVTGINYDTKTLGWAAIESQLTSSTRTATIERNTTETAIKVVVDLDSPAPVEVSTGIGFLDHMISQIAYHGGFSIDVKADGDLHIDEHHTVEDTAIALGTAIRSALGSKAGIGRYGFVLPMDEALATCSLDLSGRPFLVFDATFSREAVGGLATEMVQHFFLSLAHNLGCTLHIGTTGTNEHHKIEGMFKAFGRSLRQAIELTDNQTNSSKGVLE